MPPQVVNVRQSGAQARRRGGAGYGSTLAMFVVLALLGFLVVAQIRAQEGVRGDLRLRSVDELGRMVGMLSREVDSLQQQDAALHGESIGSHHAFRSLEAALEREQRILEELALASSTTPVRGPGVRLDIEDRDSRLTVYELTLTLNELRAAGAEAISLNGARLDFDSWFGGTPGSLVCDGIPLTPPYSFAAVGTSETLLSALGVHGGLISILAQVPGVGARGTAVPEIELPPHQETPRYFEYAEPVG